MHPAINVGVFALAMIGAASASNAGPEQLSFPWGYETRFVNHKTLDKRDQDPDVVRRLFIDPQTAKVVQAGAPLPEGARLLLVDHYAARDANGKTLVDRSGSMIPSDRIKHVLVAEKRAGFGAAYNGELPTGDWEYAAFLPDGSRKPDANIDKCRKCHINAQRTDFTFSIYPNLEALKR